MFGSYFLELAAGASILVVAVFLWRYLLQAFRRSPLPVLLRPAMAAEMSTILEIALLALGTSFVIDGLVHAIP